MTVKSSFDVLLLVVTVASCWTGVIGMWRMRTPTAALHYLAFPATAGMTALTAAVFLKTGNSQAAWKAVMIGLIMLATNSIVAHASARAFRSRELGHWEPMDGDPMEPVNQRKEYP